MVAAAVLGWGHGQAAAATGPETGGPVPVTPPPRRRAVHPRPGLVGLVFASLHPIVNTIGVTVSWLLDA